MTTGAILTALWALISAGDFAIPRWGYHELATLSASAGSA